MSVDKTVVSDLPTDGFIVVSKQDCPTCAMIAPVLGELCSGDTPLTVYSQDAHL